MRRSRSIGEREEEPRSEEVKEDKRRRQVRITEAWRIKPKPKTITGHGPRNRRPQVQAGTQDRILQGMDRFGPKPEPKTGASGGWVVSGSSRSLGQGRKCTFVCKTVVGRHLAHDPPTVRRFSGFPWQAVTVLQMTSFAKPSQAATFSCKPVVGRHSFLQNRRRMPRVFANPAFTAIPICKSATARHFGHSFATSGIVSKERKKERKMRPLLARTDKRGKESIGSAELGPQKRRA